MVCLHEIKFRVAEIVNTGCRVVLPGLGGEGRELVLNVLRISGFERWKSSGDGWW